MRLPLMRLQAEIDDWDENENEERSWRGKFHSFLTDYAAVYGIDILGPASWMTPRYLEYLARQFRERLRRLIKQGGSLTRVRFSKALREAVLRTDWAADEKQPVEIEDTEPDSPDHLEIARILMWDEDAFNGAGEDRSQERAILQMIDSYHRLFTVPVFALERSSLKQTDVLSEEFVIGLDDRLRLWHCFTYDVNGGGETRSTGLRQGMKLLNRFYELLANPNLTTIPKLLKAKAASIRTL